MEFDRDSLFYIIWILLILIWNRISMTISRESINIICRIIIVIDICMFLLTLKLFKLWLLFFYIALGAFLLFEKFERRTEAACIRRDSVSSMQDCIMCVGTFMIATSLLLLSIMR